MKTVVTGGTGFIGSHLVSALNRSGHDVAITAEPGGAESVGGVRAFPVDVSSGKGLREAFEGSEVVIHLAARNHVLKEKARDPLAEYRRVNVEGTRNVARAAFSGGVGFMIHVSSVKAMGEGSEDILDENSPCEPGTLYGISKLESEDAARHEAENQGGRLVILRLPMVYGPRNKGNLPRLIRWAESGLPFPSFRPENLRSMVYVENVVAGILAVLERFPGKTATYILKDGDDSSTRKIYTAVCGELGKEPRFLPVSPLITRLGARLSESVSSMAGSFRVSSRRIEQEIGFFPPVSFNEGIARTVRWYKGSSR